MIKTNESLHIKNMVCPRCIKAVDGILKSHKIPYDHIELGKVLLPSGFALEADVEKNLISSLKSEGFELIDDEKKRTVNSIKTEVIDWVHHDKGLDSKVNFSDYLAKKLHRDYSTLSHLFSSMEGRSIEKYVISQRIERVKELLVYGELTISEIAFELGYSSVQYLSNQFKSATGMSPAHFRKMIKADRKFLNDV